MAYAAIYINGPTTYTFMQKPTLESRYSGLHGVLVCGQTWHYSGARELICVDYVRPLDSKNFLWYNESNVSLNL